MSTRNHIPCLVEGQLDARLSPFHLNEPRLLEDLDVEASRAVSPVRERSLKLNLVNDLKLLFAALGAGGSSVPFGDNSRTARLLAKYAESLRDH